MKDLKVTFFQSHLHWENPEANRNMFESEIARAQPDSDLLILSEMFSTGFSMNPELLAEETDGPTMEWLSVMARNTNCIITGSLIIREKDNFYNRLIWMRPDGTWESYNKRHLFRYGQEHEHYKAGKEKLIVELKGWKICPLICYDLRFPVWSRNRWKNVKGVLQAEYDVLLYVANWPERRIHPWKTLLQARAIENQSYVIGVNRVGEDAHGISHSGDSAAIGFKGDLLSAENTDREYQETVVLSHSSLTEFRASFPAGMDADEFSIL